MKGTYGRREILAERVKVERGRRERRAGHGGREGRGEERWGGTVGGGWQLWAGGRPLLQAGRLSKATDESNRRGLPSCRASCGWGRRRTKGGTSCRSVGSFCPFLTRARFKRPGRLRLAALSRPAAAWLDCISHLSIGPLDGHVRSTFLRTMGSATAASSSTPATTPAATAVGAAAAAATAASRPALARTGRSAYRERHPPPEPEGGHSALTREPLASLYIAWRGLTSFLLLPVWAACTLPFTLSRRPRSLSAACQPLTELEARLLLRRLRLPLTSSTLLVARPGRAGRLAPLRCCPAREDQPSVRYTAARS